MPILDQVLSALPLTVPVVVVAACIFLFLRWNRIHVTALYESVRAAPDSELLRWDLKKLDNLEAILTIYAAKAPQSGRANPEGSPGRQTEHRNNGTGHSRPGRRAPAGPSGRQIMSKYIDEALIQGAANQAAVQIFGKQFKDLTTHERLKARKAGKFITLSVAPYIAAAVRLHDAQFIEDHQDTDDDAHEGWTGEGHLTWGHTPDGKDWQSGTVTAGCGHRLPPNCRKGLPDELQTTAKAVLHEHQPAAVGRTLCRLPETRLREGPQGLRHETAHPQGRQAMTSAGTSKATERDMLDLLLARYTDIRRGTMADRWVRAEHVKAQLGYGTGGGLGQRIAYFIAADGHPGIPYGSALALHGHEVKVSRSDWLTELRAPEKSEAIKRHMHYWWLVIPDAAIIKPGELPEGWGLMVRSGGTLRAKVKAALLNPEPVPLDFTISLMASAARTAHREPLRRDAPVTFIKNWAPRCAFCGEASPCASHQPRAASPAEAA